MKRIILITAIFLLSVIGLNSNDGNRKTLHIEGSYGIYDGEIKSIWFQNTQYVICKVGSAESSVFVINKTKEDLEIELLRLQIKKLKEGK